MEQLDPSCKLYIRFYCLLNYYLKNYFLNRDFHTIKQTFPDYLTLLTTLPSERDVVIIK